MILNDTKIVKFLNEEIDLNNKRFRLNLSPVVSGIDYPDRNLSRLRDIIIRFNGRTASTRKINDFMTEMRPLLMRMTNLDNFGIIIDYKDGKNHPPTMIDNSYMSRLPLGISTIYMSGIEINDIPPGTLSRFRSLNEFHCRNCGLKHPEIIEGIPGNAKIFLTGLDVDSHSYSRFGNFIVSRNGRFKSDVESLNELSTVRETHHMSFSSFSDNMDCLSSMMQAENAKPLRIQVDLDAHKVNDPITDLLKSKRYLDRFAEKKNFLYRSPDRFPTVSFVGDVESVKALISLKIPSKCYMKISTLSDIATSYLALHKDNIKGVSIVNENATADRNKFYSLSEFVRIKSSADKLRKQCLPSLMKGSLSEKEIFTRIYLELARTIDYDESLVDDEYSRMSSDGSFTYTDRDARGRNLAGGLIDKKAVCAGDADILRCMCNELHIKCDWLCGYGEKDGHAWNRVRLDGKYYFCDLTWDREHIRKGERTLPYFLKSSRDFGHNEFSIDRNFSEDDCKCFTSVSQSERKKLIKDSEKGNIALMEDRFGRSRASGHQVYDDYEY